MWLDPNRVAAAEVDLAEVHEACITVLGTVLSGDHPPIGAFIDVRAPDLRPAPVATYGLMVDVGLTRVPPIALYGTEPESIWDAIDLLLGLHGDDGLALVVGARPHGATCSVVAALLGAGHSPDGAPILSRARLQVDDNGDRNALLRSVFGVRSAASRPPTLTSERPPP